MKKIIIIAISSILILVSSIPINAQQIENIDELLAPYQKVIDEVNSELGSPIYIPKENKEKVYNNIKNMSPQEFKVLITDEYKACILGTTSKYKNDNYLTDSIIPNEQNEPIAKPTHIRKDIKQTAPISYNSKMFLKSTIFSGTGKSGTYTYENIKEYGSQWSSNLKGYHFAVDSGSHSLNNNRKKCTVTLKGHPEDSNGVALLKHLTETVTFSPN